MTVGAWGREDRAIVVGIDRYPALGDLSGAENDAAAFRVWLREVAQVPAEHIAYLVSSHYAEALQQVDPVQRQTLRHAMPTHDTIEDILTDLYDLVWDGRRRIGRRLYLFFAGHGFDARGKETNAEPVLITANADRHAPHHIPVLQPARWFSLAWAFDEVVLFMDCCRELCPRLTVRPLVWPDRIDEKRKGKNPYLHGFAAQPSKLARESADAGEVRGHFTRAVLAGLGGAAADARGAVTSRGLKKYLEGLAQDDLTTGSLDPNVAVNQHSDSGDFDLLPPGTHANAEEYGRVTVRVGAAHRGCTLTISGVQPIESVVDQPEWVGELRKGLYIATLSTSSGVGVQECFGVTPGEETVVDL